MPNEGLALGIGWLKAGGAGTVIGVGAGVDNLLTELNDNLLLEDGTSVLLLE